MGNVVIDRAQAAALFTIGYQGKPSVDVFANEIATFGVEILVDVRAVPWSRKKGFSKSALDDALSRVGVEYRHVGALGNPKPLRELYYGGQIAEGAAAFRRHVEATASDTIDDLRELAWSRVTCLMCFEHESCECHREVVADLILERDPGLSARHV